MNTANKKIKSLYKNSPAKKSGLKHGDIVESINGEPVLDFIDDNYFNSLSNLEISFLRKDKKHTAIIEKEPTEPLGIEYEENMYPADRQCVNNCLFCFVDQLPRGMRESLYIKDDDWRYSVLFGNYVTLTNISDKELERIVKRQASPLYISVHAIDGEARKNLMLSKKADRIKQQLTYLAENNIIMHTQVVLCPGINDGKVLDETIEYLYGLYPYVRSLAVVPVGLSGHRDSLPKLEAVNEDKAKEIIKKIEAYNKIYQKDKGINFVFASDEFYSKASLPYPIFKTGEHYPQLSNGVGMFSELKSEFNDALTVYEKEIACIDTDIKIVSVTGVSAYTEIKSMIDLIISKAENLNVNVVKILNNHFGDSITVAGLLCGRDIVNQLKNIECDVIIVPASTLKDGGNVFLDNTDIEYVEQSLGAKAIVQEIDGYAMIESIIEGAAKG
ncbi:MAG: DUF512 domain-containing protein [Clostridia bacterium]|nr:DUF512 domain-containing protein [Clostridia bacterium]